MVHFIEGLVVGIVVGGGLMFWWAHKHLDNFKATDDELAALANAVGKK